MSIPIPTTITATGPPREVAAPRKWNLRGRLPLLLLAIALVIAAVFVVRRLTSHPAVAQAIASETVALHDISQSVDATGTVEAVEVVEIKSKASGQILKMPVSIGSVVAAGDLLAQIDPLTVRNQYNQLFAALKAAQSNVAVTSAQKQRAEDLYSREAMTAVDHENAQIGSANAQASLARAQADLQIARQALNDATVRAPSAGTIVEQTATKGMVITSGTSSASGGTTLFKMADLDHIQMQALVGETDIGNLKAGMAASVTVDAFPNRTFRGHVVKIEPQAVVQQSVTMFPVLIAIENENGKLLPGMNGQVTIAIANRTQVVAVPLDAVRSMRELPAVATTLGLDADTLRAQLARQSLAAAAQPAAAATDTMRARRRGTGGSRLGASDGAGGTARASGASRGQFVMVQTESGLEPRLVRLGISDFDYSEIVSGVRAGEVVALLSVAEQAAKRKSQQDQLSKRMGSTLTGSSAPAGGGGH
jgi:HlyD family secretion protein